MTYDKTKSCKNCPDRTAEPRCHDTCEYHIQRLQKIRENKKPIEDRVYESYVKAAIKKMKRKKGK